MMMNVVLSILLFGGCSTQRIRFTSIPPGAEVQVGGRRGVTPCTLKVPRNPGMASFRLPSGEEMVLPLPEPESGLEEAADGAGTVLGGTLAVVGAATAVAGAGLFFLGAASLDSESDVYDDADDDSDAYAAMGIGFVAMAVGAGAFGLGRWMLPDEADGELQAVFIEDGQAEPVYEDTGTGARRIQRAAP